MSEYLYEYELLDENGSFVFDIVRVRSPLLPCPFCGGSAEIAILQRDVPGVGNVYGGLCLSCFSVGKPFNVIEDALEFWNTRTGV